MEERIVKAIRICAKNNAIISFDTNLREDLEFDYSYADNPDVMRELEMLDALYGKELLIWLASLYDPETGGFYYARSSIGPPQFGPDIESTAQAIGMIRSLGLGEEMSLEMIHKFITFFQSRQDYMTGYFYDPQFGSNVSNSKRERNLSQARSALRSFNAKPLYLLPEERWEIQEQKITLSNVPEYLSSAEAVRSWLEGLNWSKPWSAGHEVSSHIGTIQRLGYTEVVLDFLDETQNPETGLWGEGVSYNTISGAMKVSAYYTLGIRAYPNINKMIESTVYAIKNGDNPDNIMFLRNPLDLIHRAVFRGSNEFCPEIDTILEQNMPEIIEFTRKRLEAFRKSDYGFSYFPDRSIHTSQGAYVGLGLAEGDVNATVAGALATRRLLFDIVGSEPMLMDKYQDEFYDYILNMDPHEIQEIKTGLQEDFNSMGIG